MLEQLWLTSDPPEPGTELSWTWTDGPVWSSADFLDRTWSPVLGSAKSLKNRTEPNFGIPKRFRAAMFDLSNSHLNLCKINHWNYYPIWMFDCQPLWFQAGESLSKNLWDLSWVPLRVVFSWRSSLIWFFDPLRGQPWTATGPNCCPFLEDHNWTE